jgi:hypothetical protein
MPKLMVQVSLIDEDKEVCFFDHPPVATDWETDESGKLFRHLQREYGRCTSKVYVTNTRTGRDWPVGWCFEKRVEYYDGRSFRPLPKGHPQTFRQTAWITVSTQKEGIHA